MGNTKAWSLKKLRLVVTVSRKEWKFSSFKWKLQMKVVDNLVFRVLYVVEAIVLVSTLCCFYLCCGCHI